jgi:adhesin/invasin
MKDPLRLLLSAAALSALSVLACGKASPVAPSGTTLSISANPSTVSLNGTSTITVIGRQPNGNPLNPGTEIIFSADKGSIDTIAKIQNGGVATATFHADNRAGAVRVTASTGGSGGGGTSGGGGSTSASVDIQVGQSSDNAPTLLLSVNPSTIPVKGTAKVTIIARNVDGTPYPAGNQVILTTTLGSLSPSRPTTQSDGTATSTLTAGSQSGTATVTAVLGAAKEATTTVEIKDATLTLTANPTTIPETGGTITLTAFVANFQGTPVQGVTVTFKADRGTLAPGGNVTTDSQGIATATLTLLPDNITSDQTFQVSATAPSGSGTPLSATVTITVKDTRQ